MKPEEVAAMRPTPAPVLSPDHPRVEDAIRNIVNAHFGSTPTSTPPMSGGLGRTTSNADLRASQAGRAQARRSVTPETGIPETRDGFKSPGAAARKGLQEVADYPTGRFVDNRSHPIVDGNWTTTHLGEHKGHPSKTTVTSIIDRLPGWKSGKPSPGPVRTTYKITTRYGPTTDTGKRYKFKTKPILVSHIRPHHLVGREDLIMGDVHPTIRDTMMDHIRRHDTTLHPESPDVTELSSGRVLPTTMGGGSLSVGTVREHEFSKRGPMDEGFLKTAGHVALAGAMTLGGIGRVNSTDTGHSIHQDTGTTTEVNSDNPGGPSKTSNLVRSGSDIKKTKRTSEIPGVTTQKENLPSTRTRTTGERFSMTQGGKTDRSTSTRTSTQVGDQKPVVSSSSNQSFSISKSAPKIGGIGVSTNTDMKGGGDIGTEFKNLKQTEIAPTGKNISAITSPSFKLKRRGDSILKEEHKDLIREMHPIMFIHTDPTIPTYHVVAGETNRQTHDELAKDAIENHYNKKPSGNLSDQLLSLGPWTRIHTYPAPRVLGSLGQKSFEIEAASHETLRDTLGRIEPHIAGQKVNIEVRDPNNDDPAHAWNRNVNAEQLRDYIKHGHQARSLRSNSILKEVTTGTGRPIDIEQGERLGNLKDSLKRKLDIERSSGIEDNATYKDAPHAFRRQDSTRDKLIRIQQFMSAKGGNKNATKASNDNRTNRNAYRNYYKK